ncbi:MAG: hypothetical protein KBG15_16150 [Kofleriaceae bacterium]|nr:hypothetical protein [Kofleriaceae bacterium]
MKHHWIWYIIVVNLLGLLALAFLYPSAMLSPGDLMPVHAELADKCLASHAPFRGAVADRCIKCHAVTDIGIRTTRGTTVTPATAPASTATFHQQLSEHNCIACHSDHTPLTQRHFSHGLLRPATRDNCVSCHTAPSNDLHRNLGANCKQCHTTEHWTPATFDHALLPAATLARCESCHSAPPDNFHLQITAACTQCHSPAGWKPSTFNHDRYFVLDRDHNTTCATCHSNNDFTRYTCFGCHEHTPANIRAEHEEEGIRNFDNCVSCHRSPDDEGGDRGDNRDGDE